MNINKLAYLYHYYTTHALSQASYEINKNNDISKQNNNIFMINYET